MVKNLRFWGTSAGEGTPTPFCECDICRTARAVGGPELRLRSSFRIDEETMLDIGADFNAAALKMGETLFGLKNVLYTHTHEDHFNYMMIWTRYVARKKPDFPLNIYFVDKAYDILEKFYFTSPVTSGREGYTRPSDVNFVRLEFLREYDIGGHRVTPLRGNHATAFEDNSANYLIKLADGRWLYYGLDTGYYLDETFEYLAGQKLDILISECTMPILTDDGRNSMGHMNLHTFLRCAERLYKQGTIDEHTRVYLTHIAPIGTTHAGLCEYIAGLKLPYRLMVAYDGLSIDS